MYPSEPFYFAHRGGNESSPENSLESFLAACRLGCRYLELDLRSTNDHELVVFHDATLKRMLGANAAIASLSTGELKTWRYSNGEKILTFGEFLSQIPNDARLNIDPKTDAAAELLVEKLHNNRELSERVAIGTFSSSRIQRMRAQIPEVATVASRNEVLTIFARYLAGKGLNTPIKALQIPLTPYFRPHLRAEFADYLHEQGLQVHVWTVNSLADMQWLYARGIDAVMTDKPSIAKMFFDKRQGT